METTFKYYKNSNTGEIVYKQIFTSDVMRNIPICWYNIHRQQIKEPNLKGFVEISFKTFKRLSKKIKTGRY